MPMPLCAKVNREIRPIYRRPEFSVENTAGLRQLFRAWLATIPRLIPPTLETVRPGGWIPTNLQPGVWIWMTARRCEDCRPSGGCSAAMCSRCWLGGAVWGWFGRRATISMLSAPRSTNCCRRRRSGSMRAGQGRRVTTPEIWTLWRDTTRTAATRRIRWRRSSRTPGDFMTCTATFGNGAGIGMATIRAEASRIQLGRLRARAASVAAAAGTPTPASAAPPFASGTVRASATSARASVSPSVQSLSGMSLFDKLKAG